MAITDKKQGVWDTDEVYNKINEGGIWTYGAPGDPAQYRTWGRNTHGQLGQNDTVSISSPVQVPGSWNSVFASGSGEGTSGGVKTDGTMWTWGFNGNGQGGRNDRVHRSSPVQLGTDTTWATGVLRTGNYWTLALKTNGTLWTWGGNGEGQLGHNDKANRSSPTQVGANTTWNYAQDKYDQDSKKGMVVKTDGTLWMWGTQDVGGLGLNGPAPMSQASRSSPCQVGTDTTWNVVSVSGNSAYSIKTDGTLWAWGLNERGQLGQNQGPGGPYATSRSSPTQVGTDTTWSQIRGAGSGSLWGIKTNGTLWSWGYNSFGMLGHNDRNNRSSPTQVGTNTNWESIRGSSRALAKATKTDGTFWIWGRNDFGGAIPGGESVDFSSPVQVPGTTWSPLVGGTNYSAAVITE